MKTKEEIEILTADANSGDSNAQNTLGCAYGAGDGVDKDYAKALTWFVKSAEQNNHFACFNVGLYNELGRGTKKDVHKAIEWYKRAAELGFVKAALTLGELYEKGYSPSMLETSRGIQSLQKDPDEAFFWYKRAALSGDEGRFNYGRCFESGIGVGINLRKAVSIYRNLNLPKPKSRLTAILKDYNPEENTRLSTIELFRNNPFRILGVYANESEKTIKANLAKALAFAKVGKSVDFPTDLLLPDTLSQRENILRNALDKCDSELSNLYETNDNSKIKWEIMRVESIRTRLHTQLEDVLRCEQNNPDWDEGVVRSSESLESANSIIGQYASKIRYALFWFHCATEEDKKALHLVEQGHWEEARSIWSRSESYSASINESILDWYQREDVFAIQGILSVVGNSDKRRAFLSALHIPFETFSAIEIKHILWDALYSYFPFSEREFEWHELGQKLEYETLSDCGFDESDDIYLDAKALEEQWAPMKKLLTNAVNWDKENFKSGILLHDKLYKEGCRYITRIGRLIGISDSRYIKICDDVALELLEFAIYYNNNCKEWSAPQVALYTATWANKLAVSELLRDRCIKNMHIFEENKRIATTDKIIETLDEKFCVQEKRVPTFQVVDTMIKDAEMNLECLKSEIGTSAPLYKEVSSAAVNRILNVLLKGYNTGSKAFSDSSVLALITRLGKFVIDEKTKERVNKNKSIIRQNLSNRHVNSHQRHSTGGNRYQYILNEIEQAKKGYMNHEDSHTTKRVRKTKWLLTLVFATIAILLIVYLNNCGAWFMANLPWWPLTIKLDLIVIFGCIIATWEAEKVSDEGTFKKSLNWGSKFEIRDRRLHKVWATIAAAIGIGLIYWYLSWGNNYNYFWESQRWWICICIGVLCLLNIFIIALWFLEAQRDPRYIHVFSLEPNEADYSSGIRGTGCILTLFLLPYYFIMLPFKLATLIR